MNTRQKVLSIIKGEGGCHIGSAFSCIEILEAIYEVIKPDDKFILSKSHASSVVDALGHIPQYVEELHCRGGALGNGYGIGLGLALARPDNRVFVVVGDGEFENGATWEAFNYHRYYRVPNLYVVIDHNGWQGFKSSRLMVRYTDPFVHIVDNIYPTHLGYVKDNARFKMELLKCFRGALVTARVIIANTVKGNGIREIEDTLGSHYCRPDDATYERWMGELNEKDLCDLGY